MRLYKARAVFQRTAFDLVNKVGNHKLGYGGVLNACDLHSAVAVGRVSKGGKVSFVKPACRKADGYRSKCSILCNSSSADAEVKNGFCVGADCAEPSIAALRLAPCSSADSAV